MAKKRGPVARTKSANREEPVASSSSASREAQYQKFKSDATELFHAALDFYHDHAPPDEGLARAQPWVSCLWPMSCLSVRFDFDPTGAPGPKGLEEKGSQ